MPNGLKNNPGVPFGERLSTRRRELSLSQDELARNSGVSQSSISRYLKGERSPVLDDAVALARALSCRLEWLAGLDDEEQALPPGRDWVKLPDDDQRPLEPGERKDLEKALRVLRSKGVRGQPDIALSQNIEAFHGTVEMARELGPRGGKRPGGGGESGQSSASERKRRSRAGSAS